MNKIRFLIVIGLIFISSNIALYQQSHKHIFKYDTTAPEFKINSSHLHIAMPITMEFTDEAYSSGDMILCESIGIINNTMVVGCRKVE